MEVGCAGGLVGLGIAVLGIAVVGSGAVVRDTVLVGITGARVVRAVVGVGCLSVLVAVGVWLAVGVVVRLGVLLIKYVGLIVAVSVSVIATGKAPSHAPTPANPRLYVSSTLKKRMPVANSSSVIWLPTGWFISHP